jgi:hypothetical protein
MIDGIARRALKDAMIGRHADLIVVAALLISRKFTSDVSALTRPARGAVSSNFSLSHSPAFEFIQTKSNLTEKQSNGQRR